MDATEVSPEELKLFHKIDRKLYVVLIKYLSRDPSECLQIMGFWLWLERGGGFYNVIGKILPLPRDTINELADEAIVCLKCINNQDPCEAAMLPSTGNLVEKDLSLQFFLDNRLTISHEVQRLVNDIYLTVLSDIIEMARIGVYGAPRRGQITFPDLGQSSITAMGPRQSTMMVPSRRQNPMTLLGPSSLAIVRVPTQNSMPVPCLSQSPITSVGNSALRALPSFFGDCLAQSLSSLSIGGDASSSRAGTQANEASQANKTMFATFSKGYPVTEAEVRELLTSKFGECIESLHMQEVEEDVQALYAKVVFRRPSFVQIILNGEAVAKFTINGKHVWMRRFSLRGGRA